MSDTERQLDHIAVLGAASRLLPLFVASGNRICRPKFMLLTALSSQAAKGVP